MNSRPKSVRLGRLFVYHVQMDENRGIWAMFRIRETNQELSGGVVRRV